MFRLLYREKHEQRAVVWKRGYILELAGGFSFFGKRRKCSACLEPLYRDCIGAFLSLAMELGTYLCLEYPGLNLIRRSETVSHWLTDTQNCPLRRRPGREHCEEV